MNRIKPFAASLLVLAAGAASQLRAQAPVRYPVDGPWTIIEGKYGGKEYGGDVEIGSLGRYKTFTWNVDGLIYHGVGFYQNGMLYVGWGSGPSYGIVLYNIRPNETLDGTWIYAGSDEVPGTEHAVGGSLDKKESTYTVHGVNPGQGRDYAGTLTIRRTGDVYQLHWVVGDDSYNGVGIRSGDRLVVGWGGGAGGGGGAKDFGVTVYAVEEDRAVGQKALPERSEIGTEILGRIFVATPGR